MLEYIREKPPSSATMNFYCQPEAMTTYRPLHVCILKVERRAKSITLYMYYQSIAYLFALICIVLRVEKENVYRGVYSLPSGVGSCYN